VHLLLLLMPSQTDPKVMTKRAWAAQLACSLMLWQQQPLMPLAACAAAATCALLLTDFCWALEEHLVCLSLQLTLLDCQTMSL
jgi:hypothetical protein